MTNIHDYSKISPTTMGGLKRYIENRIEGGGFLTAVLSNNLKEAIGRADNWNLETLLIIVCWLYNEAPSDCWGSPEKVSAWLKNEKQSNSENE